MSDSKSKPKSKPKESSTKTHRNGKGDSPRNNYSSKFKSNYEKINWSKKKT